MGRRISDEEAFQFWISLLFLPSIPHNSLSPAGSRRSPTGTPCPGVCLRCGQPVRPTWDNVQKTLQPCVYCAGRKLDDAAATGKILALEIVRPLEPFPGSAASWAVQCLGCNSEGSSTYNKMVNQGRGACDTCGGVRTGETRTKRNLESCYAVLNDGAHDGYRILGHQMRGPADKRQLYLHVECPKGHKYWVYAYSWKAGSGCGSCNDRGFRKDLPAHLYVIAGSGWLKVGISNDRSLDQRLATHADQGMWQRLHLVAFESGQGAYEAELLWKSGFVPSLSPHLRATQSEVPDGYSETVRDHPTHRSWIRSQLLPFATSIASGLIVPVRQQLCDVVPCGKLAMRPRYRAMCSMHATRQRLHGSPYFLLTERREPPDDGLCSVAGCDRVHLARGFCSAHYQRDWKRRRLESPRPNPP